MRVRRSTAGLHVVAMSMAMVLLLAFIGLAFDFGRLYIARNEAQIYTDAAALTAASRLDGTLERVRKARMRRRAFARKLEPGNRAFQRHRDRIQLRRLALDRDSGERRFVRPLDLRASQRAFQ